MVSGGINTENALPTNEAFDCVQPQIRTVCSWRCVVNTPEGSIEVGGFGVGSLSITRVWLRNIGVNLHAAGCSVSVCTHELAAGSYQMEHIWWFEGTDRPIIFCLENMGLSLLHFWTCDAEGDLGPGLNSRAHFAMFTGAMFKNCGIRGAGTVGEQGLWRVNYRFTSASESQDHLTDYSFSFPVTWTETENCMLCLKLEDGLQKFSRE